MKGSTNGQMEGCTKAATSMTKKKALASIHILMDDSTQECGKTECSQAKAHSPYRQELLEKVLGKTVKDYFGMMDKKQEAIIQGPCL